MSTCRHTCVNVVGLTVCLGADILRLSREDLIQICGLADGIRLYNALHIRYLWPIHIQGRTRCYN